MIFKPKELSIFNACCPAFDGSIITTIDIFIPYTGNSILVDYKLLTDKFNRISSIFIYNAPVNESYKYSVVETGNIFLQKSHLVNTTDEPNISAAIFSLEKNLYNESLAYNTFYNRKAFIDQHGNVFNTARYINSFGNIKNKPLSAIIASDNFKEFWTVKKDVINVCKDCEFRHMCVDARVPVKRKKDEWFFPIECNYNPYIGKWKGTTGFKTLGECGIICNQDEFSIDMNVLLSESVVP